MSNSLPDGWEAEEVESDWTVNENQGIEFAALKVWHRRVDSEAEVWALAAKTETDSGTESYNVLHQFSPVSISAWYVLKNLDQIEISFSDGLSITFPGNADIEMDLWDAVESFDDRDSAEDYIRKQLS